MSSNQLWFFDKKWKLGKINKKYDNLFDIIFNDEIITINENLCRPFSNEDLSKITDLTTLSHLNEPSILFTLKERYANKNIYTKSGNILVAINPFEKLSLYSDKIINNYLDDNSIEPHVYEVAKRAIKNMLVHDKSQTILASGESGSGKTVTTKHLLHYLIKYSQSNEELENKIISSNPLIEAFGNAKTIRNDNSSRFGKFIKVFFNENKKHIISAKINTYLLEKIRVIRQNEFERNYHIFYQIFFLDEENKKDLLLKNISEYKILSNKMFCESCIDDETNLNETLEAMKNIKLTTFEIDQIFKTIALILNLGNISFDNNNVVNDEWFNNVVKLSEWTEDTLNDYLCNDYMNVHEETIKKTLTSEESQFKLNTLIQEMYSNLFDKLVIKINESISNSIESKCYIGILDIFGFEIFDHNSLEQFHINLTNESLQQIFNFNIFQEEQNIYKDEELDWTMVKYFDNKDKLDAIYKTLSLLDEECLFPKGSDKGFLNKIISIKSELITTDKIRINDGYFKFSHYAGQVEYLTTNFCTKNKHSINKKLNDFLILSNHYWIKYSDVETKITIKDTISSSFIKQLNELMKDIKQTQNHFIRCIKPNDNNEAKCFNDERIMEQLNYGGVFEAVKVSRAGYPVRFNHKYFIERYYPLFKTKEINKICEEIKKIGLMFGKTKIFLKQIDFELLEEKTIKSIKHNAILIQKTIKKWICYRKYCAVKKIAINLQLLWKRHKAIQYLTFLKQTKSITKISSWYKCRKAMSKYMKFKLSINKLKHKWIQNKLIKKLEKEQLHIKIIKCVRIQKWWKNVIKQKHDKLSQMKKVIDKVIDENTKVKEKLETSNQVNEALCLKMQYLLEENVRLKELNHQISQKKPWWSIFFN